MALVIPHSYTLQLVIRQNSCMYDSSDTATTHVVLVIEIAPPKVTEYTAHYIVFTLLCGNIQECTNLAGPLIGLGMEIITNLKIRLRRHTVHGLICHCTIFIESHIFKTRLV